MIDRVDKGRIVKLFVKRSVRGSEIPQFRIKFDDGRVEDVGRGMIAVQSFGKDYLKKSSSEMERFGKQKFYGLKVGSVVYVSYQDNWD